MLQALSSLSLTALIALAAPCIEARAQQDTGAPVCGLGKEFHAGRRAELRKRVEGGVFLFRGLPETRGYHVFRQDKIFWYLTGVESPGAALVMDPKSGREILFLPKSNPAREGWEGELWDSSDEWVSELTGFDDVRTNLELMELLGELLEPGQVVWTSLSPHVTLGDATDRAWPFDMRQAKDPLDGRKPREGVLKDALEKLFEVEVKDCSKDIADMRRVKLPVEIDAMRRAAEAGVVAMNEAIRSTRPGLGEWDLDALMSWLFRRQESDGPAYYAIVGSGPNSCQLHYSANRRAMRAGEILLIDYGPELDHYTTDITRSWPVDGKFSERQAELYDVVLAAQRAGIAAVRPGGTIREVEQATQDVITKAGFRKLVKHGACHLIGMEVHGAGSSRKRLEVGVAFTVEPGLYDTEAGIGIRIEDTVVVTEDGCEVLSGAAPKTRAALEALIAERGILDELASTGE